MKKVFAALILMLFVACSPSATAEIPDNCLSPDDIAAMRAEWNADPGTTKSKYFLDRVCVEAKLTSMERADISANIRGDADESWVLVIYFRGFTFPPEDEESRKNRAEWERKAKELESWMEDKELGDTFYVMCTVSGFDDSTEIVRRLGTPEFDYCELIR